MTNIGNNPIRCVAMKNNGTQCKCVAMLGSKVCGTHRNWENFISSNKPKFVCEEEPKYIPKNVLSPIVKKGNINEIFSIIGR
jgi:hypothetical protein